jgi:hypothetical protein
MTLMVGRETPGGATVWLSYLAGRTIAFSSEVEPGSDSIKTEWL